MAKRGNRTYYPNSGPGNKYLLAGDTTAGYFGEITSAELFEGWEIMDLSTISSGTPAQLTGLSWLKFFYKQRVVYYAKKQICSFVGWDIIYDAGMVYGERGYGLYPRATPVDQFKYRTKVENGRRWHLKVRLPQGFSSDPFATATMNTDTDNEWVALLYKVFIATGGGTEEWDNFNASDLGYNGNLESIVKETNNPTTAQHYLRGHPAGAVITTVDTDSKSTANNLWRPVLELIPDNSILFEPSDVHEEAPGLPEVAISGDTEAEDVVISPIDLYKTVNPPHEPHFSSIEIEDTLALPQTLHHVATALNPISVKIETL